MFSRAGPPVSRVDVARPGTLPNGSNSRGEMDTRPAMVAAGDGQTCRTQLSSTASRRRSRRACSPASSPRARASARSRSPASSASRGRRCARLCASSRPSGIVQVEPNRGATVRVPSAREVREAYEVRAELEGLAAALAASRCRDDDLRRLRDAQALFEESSQRLRAWKQGDGRRHAAAARSRRLDPRQRPLPPRDPGRGRQPAAARRRSPTCTGASRAT